MKTLLTFEGNITGDIQLRQTQQGKPFAAFSIAHNGRRFNAQTNQWEDGVTTFLNCVAFGALAQNMAQTIGKGCRVIAVGTLQQHNYTDQQGAQRSSMELACDTVGVDLRGQTAQVMKSSPQQSQGGQPYQQPPQQAQAYQQPQQQPAQQGGGFNPTTPPQTAPGWYNAQAEPAEPEGWGV